MAKKKNTFTPIIVKAQVSRRSGMLHIQAKGPKVNREYGVAVELAVPEQLMSWLHAQDMLVSEDMAEGAPERLYSLACTGKKDYAPAEAFFGEDGTLFLRIFGTNPLNVPEGALLKVAQNSAEDFWKFVTAVTAAVKEGQDQEALQGHEVEEEEPGDPEQGGAELAW